MLRMSSLWANKSKRCDSTNLKKTIFNLFDAKNVNTFFIIRTDISYDKIYKYND